jgi:membrane-associated protease RseP (regulator of RpoE activity)
MYRKWKEGMIGIAACAGLALLAPSARAADAASQPDRAATEKQLAEARERLDDAARDVAELSRQLYGGRDRDVVRLAHARHRGAMLGINIGESQAREDGVEVMGVSPGGAAERAGLRTGDVIVAVNDKALAKSGERSPSRELVAFMRGVEPGQVVKVEYLRAGKREVAEVTTAAAEAPMARILRDRTGFALPEGIELPEIEQLLGPGRSFRSLELVQVTPKLGKYFGTDGGLLVVRAPAGSGLQLEEGDVLKTIDGRTPDSPGHAFRILRSYQPGEKVKLGVLRNRKHLVLEAVTPTGEPLSGPARPRHPRALPVPPQPPPPPTDSGPA